VYPSRRNFEIRVYVLRVSTVVDDGARLASFADASQDFVIANHMLEHVEDPIAALEHQLRVLKPGGILYLTLPDARHSFDSPRQRTTVEHLLRDHHDSPSAMFRITSGLVPAAAACPLRSLNVQTPL
jgi:predicted SAM-dependent methyltransferase